MSDELRPPQRRDMPPRRREQRRTHLVRELRADRSRRRRWRPLIVVPAVLAVIASGAFAATRIFDDKETTDYFVVDCYEAPSLDSPSQDAFADLIAPPGQQPGDRTPAEMCAELWDAGELGSGKIVPRLASCLAHGEVAVLPGDPRTCDALGLRELPASYQAGAARFTELIERSADVLAECTTRDELGTRLTAVYTEFGRDPSEVDVPDQPLPGRDCVGGWPRPLGLFYMLGQGFTVEQGPVTAAERQRERREHLRTRDERYYYLHLISRLRRQICGYEELVPKSDRDACIAEVERETQGVMSSRGRRPPLGSNGR